MEIVELNDDNFVENISTGVVLVDFFATWCGPCKMIEPFISQVAKKMSDVKIFKVDVDKAVEIKEKYNIMSVPTLILFKDGQMIDVKMGFMDKSQIIEMIKGAN